MISSIYELKVGDKVHYQPSHYGKFEWENGIVKEVPSFATDPESPVGFQCVRVVYNCGEDWDRYQDYTSALTHIGDLHQGWKEKEHITSIHEYLGDSVYIEFDGLGFNLRLRHHQSPILIVLEHEVMNNLINFAQKNT